MTGVGAGHLYCRLDVLSDAYVKSAE